ncbi:hexokinase [Natronobacillus azotifigens]
MMVGLLQKHVLNDNNRQFSQKANVIIGITFAFCIGINVVNKPSLLRWCEHELWEEIA